MENLEALDRFRVGFRDAAKTLRAIEEDLERQYKLVMAGKWDLRMFRDSAVSTCRTGLFEVTDRLRFLVEHEERLTAAGWELDTSPEPGSNG